MDEQRLSNVLMELSAESQKVSDINQVQAIINKYDMIFSGESYNCINTIELRHTIEKVFHTNISLEELNSLVPAVCSKLGMEIVPFVKATNPLDSIPYCYQIFL